jgi:hypothetical protein
VSSLALLYNCEGNFTEAEPFYKRAMDIRERNLGLDHPDVLQSRQVYAELLRQHGRKEQAKKVDSQVEKAPASNL